MLSALALLLAALFQPATSSHPASSHWPSSVNPFEETWPARFAACEVYRDEIERAQERYLTVLGSPEPWAAQLYQESLCDPLAASHVGAAGIAQFMPATWAEVHRQLNLPPGTTPHDRIAIEAGAFYQARMMAGWTSRRTTEQRWELGLASYNAGFGNILSAQRRCDGARTWSGVQPCLRLVTGRHAAETTTYVERIRRWRDEMCAGRLHCAYQGD